ncbi:DUF1127 domain-containing protein [Thalassovita mediterranea]|jgi:uncharacterized protein YjiS (DUF1127 family)|uniref:YjiS-like domain-containing protein n=1 Tax=Thalassovita mediterranea TaxID=340021 RepID=A0A0P1GSP0_9RHOB|nr:DUF1127 domain-containing protein [Thalassovita mediterranea]MCG7573651.1 DUF1127 domain-containing protein [Phaeobacter sp. CNT1-3]CUH85842.1 hypothetical protein TM5383_03085 [Thalassovita mediterranea]SIS32633.1 Uncharacterized conserved protein YjiS, DUF1127 family [Thalassovita mediterranea]
MTTMTTRRAAALHSSRSSSLLGRLLAMQSLYRQRRALNRLDSAALKDLGLSRAEAQTEATRPIWDAPNHWTS